MKQEKNRFYQHSKLKALVVRGEEGGGSEIVQTVIVLGFAVGLGAALMLPTFIGQSGVFFAEGAAWVCAAALNLVWYYIRIGKIKRDMLK